MFYISSGSTQFHFAVVPRVEFSMDFLPVLVGFSKCLVEVKCIDSWFELMCEMGQYCCRIRVILLT